MWHRKRHATTTDRRTCIRCWSNDASSEAASSPAKAGGHRWSFETGACPAPTTGSTLRCETSDGTSRLRGKLTSKGGDLTLMLGQQDYAWRRLAVARPSIEPTLVDTSQRHQHLSLNLQHLIVHTARAHELFVGATLDDAPRHLKMTCRLL